VDQDRVWQHIDAERARFADLLDDLTEAEWETPSLCAGWRVRDVAAHLTLAQTGIGRAAVEIVKARGDVNRMIHDTAVREARLPVERYAPRIRAMAGSRRKAPGVTHLEPLIDVLVHAQDIARPLGRTHPMPLDAAAAAADRVWPDLWPFRPRRHLAGLELVATDHPWRAGSGQRVEGPLASLLLLLTGRSAAVPELRGPGVATLTGRTEPTRPDPSRG
jgi:uncharacterized protein (TIGR03083 family)